jgi:hypothetical protein
MIFTAFLSVVSPAERLLFQRVIDYSLRKAEEMDFGHVCLLAGVDCPTYPLLTKAVDEWCASNAAKLVRPTNWKFAYGGDTSRSWKLLELVTRSVEVRFFLLFAFESGRVCLFSRFSNEITKVQLWIGSISKVCSHGFSQASGPAADSFGPGEFGDPVQEDSEATASCARPCKLCKMLSVC